MKRRRRGREGQEKRERENRPPMLKKLCASAVVQGQHSEKIKGSARGNWDPREGPQPKGVGDRTTTLRKLLIGAGLLSSQAWFAGIIYLNLQKHSSKNEILK